MELKKKTVSLILHKKLKNNRNGSKSVTLSSIILWKNIHMYFDRLRLEYINVQKKFTQI